ncbi:hypothetical protein DM860_008499 [Cuscuta australis]|uniref:Uncharacterized protein n=1 Tax=Cuscuta australis TaxID=267555 RepID=A0A328D927_9ASTE|nr:hypothetical protein DM860_008499 [Cuscuta australis]
MVRGRPGSSQPKGSNDPDEPVYCFNGSEYGGDCDSEGGSDCDRDGGGDCGGDCDGGDDCGGDCDGDGESRFAFLPLFLLHSLLDLHNGGGIGGASADGETAGGSGVAAMVRRNERWCGGRQWLGPSEGSADLYRPAFASLFFSSSSPPPLSSLSSRSVIGRFGGGRGGVVEMMQLGAMVEFTVVEGLAVVVGASVDR